MLNKQQLIEIFHKHKTFFAFSFLAKEFYRDTLLPKHPKLLQMHRELQNTFQNQALLNFSLPAALYRSNGKIDNMLVFEQQVTNLVTNYRHAIVGSFNEYKIPGGLLTGSMAGLATFLSNNPLIQEYMLRKFENIEEIINECQADIQKFINANRIHIESLCDLNSTSNVLKEKGIHLSEQDLIALHTELVAVFRELDVTLPIDLLIDHIYENHFVLLRVNELINTAVNKAMQRENLTSAAVENGLSPEFHQTILQKIAAIKVPKTDPAYKQLVFNTIDAAVEMEIYQIKAQQPIKKSNKQLSSTPELFKSGISRVTPVSHGVLDLHKGLFSEYLNLPEFAQQQDFIIEKLVDNPLIAKIVNHFTNILLANFNPRLGLHVDTYLKDIFHGCTMNDKALFSIVINGYDKLKKFYPQDSLLFPDPQIITQIKNNVPRQSNNMS